MSASKDPRIVPVLVIIGPVGIGKSSASDAVSEILSERSTPHAIIDLDGVRQSYPAPENDSFNMSLGFKNLAAVWSNYKEAGATCLIIPNVMESTSDFDKIRAAIPGAVLFVVRLEAPLQVNHERIRGREKTAESLAWHLNRSSQVSSELREKELEDVIVETESKSPRQVGEEIVSDWDAINNFGSGSKD